MCEPIIYLIEELEKDGKKEKRTKDSNLGGTMRLGAYTAKLKKNSLLEKIYNKEEIQERHRHRYEVNKKYKDEMENKGLIFSGTSPDGEFMECIELKDHPFFVGVQFHPELKSRPFAPAPLFVNFIKEAINNKK